MTAMEQLIADGQIPGGTPDIVSRQGETTWFRDVAVGDRLLLDPVLGVEEVISIYDGETDAGGRADVRRMTVKRPEVDQLRWVIRGTMEPCVRFQAVAP